VPEGRVRGKARLRQDMKIIENDGESVGLFGRKSFLTTKKTEYTKEIIGREQKSIRS
jgi:hypothetical protein